MKKNRFVLGLKLGMPIALGYLPVAFSFGTAAVTGGLSPLAAIMISVTNLTSAGQFAGLNLILQGAALIEIAVTVFVINIRYSLMSISLSQRIEEGMPLLQRALIAFGVTDEVFAVASMHQETLDFPMMMGLIAGPFAGWAIGTALGAYTVSFLPIELQQAMGIALYAMFLALFIPKSKKSKAVALAILMAVFFSAIFTWVPGVKEISSGFAIVIASVLAAALAAKLFPIREEA